MLLTKVLQLVQLPDRVKLSLCSKSLLATVTKHCPMLWETIDFACLERKQRQKLTNTMLAAILTRVDAREVTTFLSLRGCHSIRGHGLDPLGGSRVLERVNLRAWNIEEDIMLDFLRTLLPYELIEVLTQEGIRPHPESQAFLRELYEKKGRRGLGCSACQKPVVAEGRQVVFDKNGRVPPATSCLECEKLYCRNAACPIALNDCQYCKKTSCEKCDLVRQCSECAEACCNDCFYCHPPCYFCNQKFCEACSRDGDSVCSQCNRTVCKNCAEPHNIHTDLCGECGNHVLCTECISRNGGSCSFCMEERPAKRPRFS